MSQEACHAIMSTYLEEVLGQRLDFTLPPTKAGTHGFVVGHISPEAAAGGPIALLRNGDLVTIDARRRTIAVSLSAAEMKRRRAAWKAPKPYTDQGVLAKYARNVSSASLGAVTD